MKKLVAFFSASGVTGGVAARLAAAANADLFEIAPQTPYTAADLKWTNPLARCNREKVGKKAIPLAAHVVNWEAYDTVFLGFPIWYYGAPNVIETFVREYDWSGKTVALFATSGGTDIAKTAVKLPALMKGCEKIAGAKLFSPGASEGELQQFAQSVTEE